MKGKTKTKNRKVAKVLILAVSFVLTAVLSVSMTMAWFFDTDWASTAVTMAGAVGIEMRDGSQATSGSGNLHFVVESEYSYPGQAVEVEASVFNNGGSSVINHFGKTPTYAEITGAAGTGDLDGVGSACYIRAHFAVYTNIGTDVKTYPDGATEAEKTEIDKQFEENAKLNSTALYSHLVDLVKTQNQKVHDDNRITDKYQWVYYRNNTPVYDFDGKTYYMGLERADDFTVTGGDEGYFYLCMSDGKTLKPLQVGEDAAFLWNSTFVIPWQLNNFSADKDIFIGVIFQAVQTFIPKMDVEGNKYTINGDADNQLDSDDDTSNGYQHDYDAPEVQIVFNTCRFTAIDTVIDSKDYGDASAGYTKASAPESTPNLAPTTGA